MKSFLKHLAYAAIFPLYSLIDRRFGFTVFWPRRNEWRAFTRGRCFNVREPRTCALEYFRRFVPERGGIVFDVGGELGYETQQFSDFVGLSGMVLVFECFPKHVQKLREIASARTNVRVIEKACWNSSATLQFYSGRTPGSNTAVANATGQRGQPLADPEGEQFWVSAGRLDDFWREYTNGAMIDFLKMDIEGAEYEALSGATEMLAHTRKVVVAAYHIRDGVRTADRVASMLRSAGFAVEIGDNYHVYARRG